MRWFLIALWLVSCAPTSMEEFRQEGESIVLSLIQCLEKIETPADLKAESPRLKKKFAELADLMAAAKKCQLKTPKKDALEPNLEISDSLKAEFVRIYRIEGCQEIMEEIQRESLHSLK